MNILSSLIDNIALNFTCIGIHSLQGNYFSSEVCTDLPVINGERYFKYKVEGLGRGYAKVVFASRGRQIHLVDQATLKSHKITFAD